MAITVPFAASSVGSYWYEAGHRLRLGLLPRGYDLVLNTRVPDTENAMSVGRGDSAIGVTAETFLAWAQGRVGPYAGCDLRELCVITALNNAQWIAAAVDRSSGITRLREIAERRYPWKTVLPLAHHATTVYVDRLLELHGITRDKITEWGGSIFHPQDTSPRTEGPGEPWIMRSVTRQLAEQHLADGFMNYTRWTNVWARDLTTLLDLRFIAFDEAAVRQVHAELGGHIVTLPAQMYRGLEDDITTIGWRYDYIYGPPDTPAELVSAILDVLEDEAFLQNAVAYSYSGRPASLPPGLRYHAVAAERLARAELAGT